MRRISLVGLRVLLGALLLAAPAGCSVAAPQTSRKQTAPAPSPSPSPSDAIDRRTSEPYKGDLSIFEDPNRAQNLQVERVMDILGVKAGSGVADIGAGSGWFTVRAARRVGDGGLVYAVEINADYLKHIEERAAREKLSNVRAVLGREEDPLLPDASVDAVLLLKTYHEVAQPVALLRHVRRAMRAGARLGVIDRNGKGDDHGLDADVVIKEAGRAGFKLVEQYDFVKPDGMDYFLVFQASD
ncbi:MAG TPA: class I SAM-dependent methyltransferase [Pyrinomonadaceae bacterium]|jgi:predicted methyltransferase|nr:class I SAM-dependent methyltransferase [Pyrinomonadaceae bacterium]